MPQRWKSSEIPTVQEQIVKMLEIGQGENNKCFKKHKLEVCYGFFAKGSQNINTDLLIEIYKN